MHMDELNRKVCGWLVRDGNAAVGGSFMWARTMGGECYCGNLFWQSCRTLAVSNLRNTESIWE